jgi:hypothetical protein
VFLEEDMRTISNSAQRCMICGTRLSQYNDDILCFACQKKEVDKSINNMLRQPIRNKPGIRTINPELCPNGPEFLGYSRARVKI